jgi:hypothetical protein
MIGPIASLSNTGNEQLIIRYDENTTRTVEGGGWETLQTNSGPISVEALGQVIAEITYPNSSSFLVAAKNQVKNATFDLIIPMRS